MNPASLSEAKNLFKSYYPIILNKSNKIDVSVFVPSIFYYPLLELKEKDNLDLKLGIQDSSTDFVGARTGETSVKMLKADSAVILGHSETRQNFSLSDNTIAKKLKNTVENQTIPILCIGYSNSLEINYNELENQIKTPLKELEPEDLKTDLIIAYEPVWAIGSGKSASPEIVAKVTNFIKDYIQQNFISLFDKTKVLYGGSVKTKNILELAQISNLDGFLIGGASLDINEFEGIIKVLTEASN